MRFKTLHGVTNQVAIPMKMSVNIIYSFIEFPKNSAPPALKVPMYFLLKNHSFIYTSAIIGVTYNITKMLIDVVL